MDFDFSNIDLGSLGSTLGGAAMRYYAEQRAAKQQAALAAQARARQLMMQDQAAQVAQAQAAQYAPDVRQQQQQQIQQDMTAQYDKAATQPMVTPQGVSVGATIPDGQGGTDYTLAKAKETAKTQASLHALAGIMGRIGAPTELRRNEAVGLGDATQTIGRIGSNADNTFAAAQPGIAAAGQPNLGLLIGSEALRRRGANGLAWNGVKMAPSFTGDYSEYGKSTGGNGAFI